MKNVGSPLLNTYAVNRATPGCRWGDAAAVWQWSQTRTNLTLAVRAAGADLAREKRRVAHALHALVAQTKSKRERRHEVSNVVKEQENKCRSEMQIMNERMNSFFFAYKLIRIHKLDLN
jgi:hypothetical protein